MKYRKAPMFPREGAAAGREFPTMRSSRFNCERAGAHAKNESASVALRKRITGKGKNGAGDRSRTGVASLGSWSSAIELHQLGKMAIRRGLEPLTSSVTGWHSNQLNYRAAFTIIAVVRTIGGPSGT